MENLHNKAILVERSQYRHHKQPRFDNKWDFLIIKTMCASNLNKSI